MLVVWTRVSHQEHHVGDEGLFFVFFFFIILIEYVEVEVLEYFQGKLPNWPSRNLIGRH